MSQKYALFGLTKVLARKIFHYYNPYLHMYPKLTRETREHHRNVKTH